MLAKRLLGDTAWVFLARLIIGGSSIVLVAILSRLMSPDDLGHYMLLLSMVLGISIFSMFGMDQLSVRELAKFAAKHDGVFPLGLVKVFFITVLIMLMVSFSILYFGKELLDQYFFKSTVFSDNFVFVGLWTLFFVIAKLTTECFRGMHKVRIASFVGETLAVILLISIVSTLLIFAVSIELSMIIWVMVLSYGISSIVGMIILSTYCSHAQDDKNKVHLREAFAVGRPLTMIAVVSFFISQADLWVLALFFEAKDVAVYGVVLRVIALISIPLMIVNLVIKPYIPSLYEKGEKEKLEVMLRTICTLVLIPSIFFLSGLFFYGDVVLGWLFGESYKYGATALSILVFAQLVQIGTGSCGTLLLMLGYQKELLHISLFNGAILFLCLFILVEPYGIIGCAVSTTIAAILQNVIILIIAKKRTGISTYAMLNFNSLFLMLKKYREIGKVV